MIGHLVRIKAMAPVALLLLALTAFPSPGVAAAPAPDAVGAIYSGTLASGGWVLLAVDADRTTLLGLHLTGPVGGDCKLDTIGSSAGVLARIVDGSFATNGGDLAIAGSIRPDGPIDGTLRLKDSRAGRACDSGEQAFSATPVAASAARSGAGERWMMSLTAVRSATVLPGDAGIGPQSAPGSYTAKPGYFFLVADVSLSYVSSSQADVVSTLDAVLIRQSGEISSMDGRAGADLGGERGGFRFGGGTISATRGGRLESSFAWVLPHTAMGEQVYLVYRGGPAIPFAVPPLS
jgi:hypothetical protein